MSIAVTNIGTGGSTATASLAITVPAGGVPAGALIFVIADCDNTNITLACSDTAGNTYTRVTDNSAWSVTLFYAWNVAPLVSGNHITVTTGGSSALHIVTASYATGIQTTADPYDSAVHAFASNTSSTPSVTSGTPSVAGELIVGFAHAHGGSTTLTQATGGVWLSPPNAINNPGNPCGMAASQVNAGTGTKTYNPVDSTSISWDAAVYGFKAATTAQTLTLLAAPGAYTISGPAGKLATARLFKLAAGSYTITGAAAKFVGGRLFKLAAGSYTISGAAAKLETDRSVQAQAGSYALSGLDAKLATARLFTLAAGSYSITGASALLGTALPAAAGSYALTGFDATLSTARLLKLAAGSYTITGDAASFPIARVILAQAGVYTLTGFDVSLHESDTHLLGQAGVYSLGGADATLIVVRAATENDRDHGGERGQSQGRMPPPERRHHAELELFRNREYARAVAAAVPPPMIAHRNLTTTQHPTSRPVTVPIPPGRHK